MEVCIMLDDLKLGQCDEESAVRRSEGTRPDQHKVNVPTVRIATTNSVAILAAATGACRGLEPPA